jgi:methylaspartate ammonia-lyase
MAQQSLGSPVRISDIIAVPVWGGFFFDDQAAIKAGAPRDGMAYLGAPVTPGYMAVREPAEAVSVLLILSDGYVARGDCAGVQYAGVGGREPRLHARDLAASIERDLAPALRGLEMDSFRHAAMVADDLIAGIDGPKRATAYGVSQALLDAASHVAGHHLMARTVQEEWNLARPLKRVPIYAQTGEDRYTNVDKMILKQVDVLPHGLINTPDLVGDNGETLVAYIRWIRDRIQVLATTEAYRPVIHLDVYGMIGAAASGDIERMAAIIARLEEAAGPHRLRIEHPLDAGSREGQISALLALRQSLKRRDSQVELIADEWANTVEDILLFAKAGATDLIQIKTPDLGSVHHTVDAILACQRYGVGAVLGGTCAETDRSAGITVHIGVATGAIQMLAKPGMGVDEGLAIVRNEMERALKLDAYLTRSAMEMRA